MENTKSAKPFNCNKHVMLLIRFAKGFIKSFCALNLSSLLQALIELWTSKLIEEDTTRVNWHRH